MTSFHIFKLLRHSFLLPSLVVGFFSRSQLIYCVYFSYEIDGTLLDFSTSCPSHKSLRLSTVTTSMPSWAALWTAKNVYELAQGMRVAESLQLSPASRGLFFTNNSPLASIESFEKPSAEDLVRVMVKLASSCKERHSAFATAAFKKLTCSATALQPDLKLLVAESARAELDSKKALRNDAVIVLGGQNAQVLSEVLSATYVEAATVPDVSIDRK